MVRIDPASYRSLMLTNPKETWPRDVLPPAGWQPKSDFFKSIMKDAQFQLEHPTIRVKCPCCGEVLVIQMSAAKVM